MDLKKTGALIYAARKKLNLTQNELGSILGVTGKAVSKWENGYSFPDVGLLTLLSETLSVPVSSLVSGELAVAPPEQNARELVKLSASQTKRRKKIALAVSIPVAVILVFVIVIMLVFLAFASMPPSASKQSSFAVASFCSDSSFTADIRCYVGAEGAYGDCGSLVFTQNKNYADIRKSLVSSAEKHGFSFDSASSLFYKKNENNTIDYFYVVKVNSYYKNVVLLATGLKAHLLAPSSTIADKHDDVACDILLPLHLIADQSLRTPHLYIPSYAEYRTSATIETLCAFYEKTGYFDVSLSSDGTTATVVSNSLCKVSTAFGFDITVHSGSPYVRFFPGVA